MAGHEPGKHFWLETRPGNRSDQLRKHTTTKHTLLLSWILLLWRKMKGKEKHFSAIIPNKHDWLPFWAFPANQKRAIKVNTSTHADMAVGVASGDHGVRVPFVQAWHGQWRNLLMTCVRRQGACVSEQLTIDRPQTHIGASARHDVALDKYTHLCVQYLQPRRWCENRIQQGGPFHSNEPVATHATRDVHYISSARKTCSLYNCYKITSVNYCPEAFEMTLSSSAEWKKE